MKKKVVTLNLDEDVIALLTEASDKSRRSKSNIANLILGKRLPEILKDIDTHL